MICPFCEKTIGDDYVVCPVCNKRLPLKAPSLDVKKHTEEAEELDLDKAYVDGKPLNSHFGGLDDLLKLFSGGSLFGDLFDDDIFSGGFSSSFSSSFSGSLFSDTFFSNDEHENTMDEDNEKAPKVMDLEQSADGTFKSKKKRH